MPVPGTTLRSFRPQIQGVNGVVVSSHPSASMAGLDVLRRGGNAIDAGVAVGLALNIVHADDCGFLGVAPTIMYLADRMEVTTIDGLGVWPKAASVEYFQRNHNGQMPSGIPRALTPGAADAWFTALARYGTMSFAEVVGPAIALAEQGFPMYRYLADRLRDAFDLYAAWPSNAEIFLAGGRAPTVGEMFYQKDAADTLAQLVAVEDANRAQGREGALMAARDFVYKGELAQKIVSFYQSQGGLLTMADLAEYKVRIEPPVTVNYHGYDLYCCGPWCQGPLLPQALKILEGFDLKAMGHNSAEYIHAATQALNLAFADREQYIGDPAFVDVPIDEMMSEAYAKERRTLIDPERAWPVMPPAGDPRRCRATLDGAPQSPAEAVPAVATAGEEGGGTSYFGVIDNAGNIFSSTPSEGMKGGGPVIPGTGLYLSQRGGQSKLQDGHPASVAPGKRPRLTPAPALVLRDGQPVMALGAHGGDHIPQGTLQIFLNVVEFGLDPQEAVEAARFYSYNFPSSGFPSANRPGVVRTEGRISQETVDGLQRRGHTVERYPDWWEGSALYGVITRNPETGVLQGGADPRCEAYAVGY
ncbi:MAG: gamma-glutamyltransferase family protein [Chloroflexota bacterium]|nr:gamma-glutamyltransferase family protein [Chloroflexota bacterium]